MALLAKDAAYTNQNARPRLPLQRPWKNLVIAILVMLSLAWLEHCPFPNELAFLHTISYWSQNTAEIANKSAKNCS